MLEIEFSSPRPFDNTPEFRSTLGSGQPLDSPAGSNDPAPTTVETIVSQNTLKIRFHGIKKSDVSTTTIDAWASSVTSALPNTIETARREVDTNA